MPIEAWLTLLVILIALTLFVTEIVTVDLAALIVMSLLLVLGLVSPQEGISGFSNPATITVLAMFILSAGVERTGLVAVLAQRIAPVAGKKEFGQLVIIMLIVMPVSAFINNTAAVAIMVPLVVGIARDTGRAPSKLLIPLSFASMLGGAVTLIGTSTNLLASAVSADLGHGALTMFAFTGPGIIIAAVGFVYLLAVGRFLTPDRGVARAERFNVQEFLGEARITGSSTLVGTTVAEADLTGRYGVEVVKLTRAEGGVDLHSRTRLRADDRLLLLGEREKIIELASLEGLAFKGESDGLRTREKDDIHYYEVLVAPQSRLVGRTLRNANFRVRYGGTVIAVRKGVRVLHTHDPISGTPLDAGDSLLIAGSPDDRTRAAETADLLLVEELGGRKFRREKMWVALAILAGVVGFAAFGVFPILVTALTGAALMAVLGVLRMDELHRAIRWDILFLLAGVIPLGIAMQNSGLADAIAGFVLTWGVSLHPLITLTLVYAVTTLLTEIMSNNASVVLLLPIASATAIALGLDPMPFILAVAFAASSSFLTPIGYQTNMLIYGPGGYRFEDYARVGLGLKVILIFLTPWVITWFYPLTG